MLKFTGKPRVERVANMPDTFRVRVQGDIVDYQGNRTGKRVRVVVEQNAIHELAVEELVDKLEDAVLKEAAKGSIDRVVGEAMELLKKKSWVWAVE